METVITFSDSEGNYKLPNKAVIADALKDGYTNSAFWNKIKSGKLPYIINKEENKLIEASFEEASLNYKCIEVYWLTDDDVPYVNAFVYKICEMDRLKQEAIEVINKFK